MKIGILVSSTRPSRIGPNVAEWIAAHAPEGVQAEIIDLADVRLPFFQDANHPAQGEYTEPTTLAWAERVSGYDAMIFPLAEYNGGYTAQLKNAIDTLFGEWNDLPVGVVGYGFGAGGRAVEALRPVLQTVKAVQVDGPGLAFNTHISVDGELLDAAPAGELVDLYAALAAKVPARV